MRVRRAHKHHPGGAWKLAVVAEYALAEEQAVVLRRFCERDAPKRADAGSNWTCRGTALI